MRNFLSKFRIAWRFLQNYQGTDLPEDYWTMADARWWSGVLTSDSGTKVRWYMRKRVSDTAQRAIMENSDKGRWLAGYAAGVRGTVAELDALLDLARTKEGFALTDEELEELVNKERSL